MGGALSNVPFLGGYLEQGQRNEQQSMGNLQALGSLMHLQKSGIEMQAAQDDRQQLAQFRATLPPALQSAPDFVIREYAKRALSPAEPKVVGRTLMDSTGKVLGVDSTWQGEQQAAREQRKAELEMRLADQRTSREEQAALRRELAANASADRRMIAGMVDARREQKNVPKLPTSALKMQQEELDAIGTAGTIGADLGAISGQVEGGKINLGPVNNLMSKAKNLVGASDESSRNFATFQATLEKLRNDSLRLNKGVQTEGDAQRAWNELLANINDKKVVSQRLNEIMAINKRAANLRRMNVDNIRSNFGVDPLDTAGYQNQPSAVGNGGMPAGNTANRQLSTDDKQALDWAMANKGDPRSAAIKAKLGVK